MLPVAILAGGLGTRMRPVTESIPKAMIEVCGEPFVSHQLHLLARSGVKSVVLCTGYLGEQIMSFVGTGERFGLSVTYSSDWPELLGTGGALKKALPLLGEKFMILYGDSYLDVSYRDVAEFFIRACKKALMTLYKNLENYDTNNVIFKENEIVLYSKKYHDPRMNYIDYGLLGIEASVLLNYRKQKFDLADVFEELSLRKEIVSYVVSNRFYEIGSFKGRNDFANFLEFGETV